MLSIAASQCSCLLSRRVTMLPAQSLALVTLYNAVLTRVPERQRLDGTTGAGAGLLGQAGSTPASQAPQASQGSQVVEQEAVCKDVRSGVGQRALRRCYPRRPLRRGFQRPRGRGHCELVRHGRLRRSRRPLTLFSDSKRDSTNGHSWCGYPVRQHARQVFV